MKTVTYEGKEYQIGALYEFSNDEEHWVGSGLVSVNSEEGRPFFSRLNCYHCIREIQNPNIGTIKDASVELIDGKAYQFEYCGEKTLAYYSDDDKAFGCCIADYDKYKVDHVSNIVPLVPEVK
jgi:hypothetical protein